VRAHCYGICARVQSSETAAAHAADSVRGGGGREGCECVCACACVHVCVCVCLYEQLWLLQT